MVVSDDDVTRDGDGVQWRGIVNFFPPNRGVDFYFEFLPAKSKIEEIESGDVKYIAYPRSIYFIEVVRA